MDENAVITLVGFAIRIVGAIVCSNKAKDLNRNSTAWAFWGFFFPIIAMIWVHLLKPKVSWHEDDSYKEL